MINRYYKIKFPLMVLSIILIFSLGLFASPIVMAGTDTLISVGISKFYETPNSEWEIVENCKGLNVKATSRCFRININTFFSYDDIEPYYSIENGNNFLVSTDKSQSSWVEKSISTDIKLIDYLKENGGVCSEWTDLYFSLCGQTSFECGTIEISDDSIFGHQYATMSDGKILCELDQQRIKCYGIKE